MRKPRKRKQKVDVTQCRKCLYRPPKNAEYSAFGCFYIIYTGSVRPCEPSPNCTAFKPYNEKDRREIEKRMKNEWVKNKGVRFND